tara:strand:- start:690 stop:1028 length:339 start_codon:yes stop_codon:yes gene_type:complete
MTFNLNVPLADAIDALPVKNRSEWMNNVLPDVLEGRDTAENLRRGGERALEAIDDELLFEAAESQGIMDTFSDSRLIAVLLVRNGEQANGENIATVKKFLTGKRPRTAFKEF